MKTLNVILFFLLVFGSIAIAAEVKSPAVLLQEGLYAEETEGNLDKAIEIYQQVIEQSGETQRIAAQATYQLGICFLKKDQKKEAAEYFQKVVSNYPDQTTLVEQANQQLDKVGNKVKILSISPDINTPLQVGNSYKIAVEVEYSLKQDNGLITLVLQRGDATPSVSSSLGNVTEPITKGNGKLTLKANIIVPSTNSIQVFTPLSVPGESQTTTVDMRVLKVVGNLKREVSQDELETIVQKAVFTISTCAETDPRIAQSLDSLKDLDQNSVVSELAKYLDDPTATVRRSAIFILWKGGFDNIAPAEEKLLKLCQHEENFTRGMAAITLGAAKVSSSFETLKDMTLNDKDGYARRCAAYALGLYGDKEGLSVLEKALQDEDQMVKNNAQAAITMLTKLNTESTKTNKMEAENFIAEGWKLWQEKKLIEAEEKFKAAIELDPQAENAYQGLGWAQLNQGKKLNAKDSFGKCIEINPKNSAALNGLGWIAHGENNIDKAIEWWQKAVEASNGTATASLSGLTQVYMEKGDYANAIKYYQMWLKAEPDNKQAQEGLKKAKASKK